MSDKDILDHLVSTQHYDRRERPPSESKNDIAKLFPPTGEIENDLLPGGGAVQVNVSAIITDIKWRTDDYSELVRPFSVETIELLKTYGGIHAQTGSNKVVGIVFQQM